MIIKAKHFKDLILVFMAYKALQNHKIYNIYTKLEFKKKCVFLISETFVYKGFQ